MKTFFMVLVLMVNFESCLAAIAGQPFSPSYVTKYIEDYKGKALEQQEVHRIPASITLAQAMIESDFGRSYIARRYNNHFGITCHGTYQCKKSENQCYRIYKTSDESYADHSRVLKDKRYEKLYSLKITDYQHWAYGLQECGYAESDRYAATIIRIIERYNLHELDR